MDTSCNHGGLLQKPETVVDYWNMSENRWGFNWRRVNYIAERLNDQSLLET